MNMGIKKVYLFMSIICCFLFVIFYDRFLVFVKMGIIFESVKIWYKYYFISLVFIYFFFFWMNLFINLKFNLSLRVFKYGLYFFFNVDCCVELFLL